MSCNVDEPLDPFAWMRFVPVALETESHPVMTPEKMRAMLDSSATAHLRPNPAHGAPKPAGYNPVA